MAVATKQNRKGLYLINKLKGRKRLKKRRAFQYNSHETDIPGLRLMDEKDQKVIWEAGSISREFVLNTLWLWLQPIVDHWEDLLLRPAKRDCLAWAMFVGAMRVDWEGMPAEDAVALFLRGLDEEGDLRHMLQVHLFITIHRAIKQEYPRKRVTYKFSNYLHNFFIRKLPRFFQKYTKHLKLRTEPMSSSTDILVPAGNLLPFRDLDREEREALLLQALNMKPDLLTLRPQALGQPLRKIDGDIKLRA